MKLKLLLTVLAAGALVSCSSPKIAKYRPVTGPEKIEFRNDRLDIYPEDVRKVPALFDKFRLAWAGIIVSNEATEEELNGKIAMDTVFEHHYFDWVEDKNGGGQRLLISPRGEGRFRMKWHVTRHDSDATDQDALAFAAPGKLAIVYGTPETVDDDGTVVMRYHYIRVLSAKHFTDNDIDYGRLGEEPFKAIGVKTKAGTNAPPR